MSFSSLSSSLFDPWLNVCTYSIYNTGAKLAFIIFRQRYQELQGVIAVKEGQVSENMVKVIEHLPAETIVLVHAVVQDPHSHGQNDIHYTSIHNVEVRIKTVSWSYSTLSIIKLIGNLAFLSMSYSSM